MTYDEFMDFFAADKMGDHLGVQNTLLGVQNTLNALTSMYSEWLRENVEIEKTDDGRVVIRTPGYPAKKAMFYTGEGK